MGSVVERIAQFVPTYLQSEIIEGEVRKLLPSCCRTQRIDVRPPSSIIPPDDNLKWHQDGGGPEGTTAHLVLWASRLPTHLCVLDGNPSTIVEVRQSHDNDLIHKAVCDKIDEGLGEVIQFEPFDLFYVDNHLAFHKQPCDNQDRWFLAIRCCGNILGA